MKRVGLALHTCDKKTKVCSDDGGPARTVTSWTLVTPQRDSLLELASSDSLRFQPNYMQVAAAAAGDRRMAPWNVAATLDAHQPEFRWQSLTRTERPAHWMPRASSVVTKLQQHESQSSGRRASGEKKRRKRKSDQLV